MHMHSNEESEELAEEQVTMHLSEVLEEILVALDVISQKIHDIDDKVDYLTKREDHV